MNGAPRIDDMTISGERTAVPSATQNADRGEGGSSASR
jgi:hypothetical protein